MRLLGSILSVGVLLTPFQAVMASSKPTSTVILLDIDNTLYQEKDAGIESQIVQNTHAYCQEILGLDKEQADDLYRAYGSTVEGLKQTLWKDMDPEHLQAELGRFYEQVYKDIDMTNLLLSERRLGSSTGYSHAKDRKLLCKLLQSCPHSLCVSSNSPSWHIDKVLRAMGLSKLVFSRVYTPDRLPSFPTKHAPGEFFGDLKEDHKRLLVFDDSTHNLDRIFESYPDAEFVHITPENSLANALLHTLGLVDDSYDFNQVEYLVSKNKVDRQSIHAETWNQVVAHLRGIRDVPIQIVDVGAGLLSMFELLINGDAEHGLNALFGYPKENTEVHYTAYESNRDLYDACHERLISWGFSLKERVSDDEFLYQYQGFQLRFLLKDFGDSIQSESAPHLIVGCCFADLMDPSELVPAMYRAFNLLESQGTLIYFPITFCGTTQFLPSQPFEQEGTSETPSDTTAFGLYAKSLTETLGHNLDPFLLQQVMEGHGASLQAKGASNWKIDPKLHPYLFDTLLYFFGTAGGPEILEAGWDASGWIQRAKDSRPTVQVSNVDLLFRAGKGQTEENCSEVSSKTLHEIMFTAPETVTTTEKGIPELGPNEILIQSSHSLISSGTELKIFKGMFDDAALDINIKGMEEERMAYPLSYGYCLVGHIVKCGENVSPDYIGKLAFAFSGHASHVVANVDSVQIVPDGIAAQDAIFMPSIETALSLVHDAHVRVGENIAVYGQGLIGLLVTAILKHHNQSPVSGNFGTITVFDTISDRLAAAAQMGASQALFPGGFKGPFDVSIEVSGNARALQSAIDNTMNGGRIIVGSWYGNTDVQLKLGIDFHRSHKTIVTSQVSEIPASLLGLWNKKRRFELTWGLVRQIRPSRLLTKTTDLMNAQSAYEALDKGTEIAVAFDYKI